MLRAIICLWERAATKGQRTMSPASAGGGISRTEMERRLIERSLGDETFRQRLLDDPKAAVEQELGSGLPEGIEVRVLEESSDTIYLVLPSASAGGQGGSLSERDLEAVAGAGSIPAETYENLTCSGALC